MPCHRVPSPLESLKPSGLYHKTPWNSYTGHQAKPFICSQQVCLKLLNSCWGYPHLGTDQRSTAVPQRAGKDLQHGPEPRQLCSGEHKTSSIPCNTPHPAGNPWAIQQCLWHPLLWPVSPELLVSSQLRLQSYGQLQQRNRDWMTHSSGPLTNFYYWSFQTRGRTVQGRKLHCSCVGKLIPHSCKIDGYLSPGSKFMCAGKPGSVTTTIQANPKKGIRICYSISQLSGRADLQYITFNPVWTSFYWEVKSTM